MKLYEAMFIVNNNAAKENYEKVEAEALGCITRHGGEIVNTIKWDERRLTYEINKQKRGTFILCHFNAPFDSIGKIEKQCRLSEVILRVLIVIDTDGPEAKVAPTGHDELGADSGRPSRDGRRHQRETPEVKAPPVEATKVIEEAAADKADEPGAVETESAD